MFVPFHKRIRGLKVTLKPGDVIALNDGEVLFQVTERNGNQIRIGVLCDPTKYTIDRKYEPKPEQLCSPKEDLEE